MTDFHAEVFARLKEYLPDGDADRRDLPVLSKCLDWIDKSYDCYLIRTTVLLSLPLPSAIVAHLRLDEHSYVALSIGQFDVRDKPEYVEEIIEDNPGLVALLLGNEVAWPILGDRQARLMLRDFYYKEPADGESFVKIPVFREDDVPCILDVMFPVFIIKTSGYFPSNRNSLFSIHAFTALASRQYENKLGFSSQVLEEFQQLLSARVAFHIGENVFNALWSYNWRHSFMELYRCIEYLYGFDDFLTFTKELEQKHGVTTAIRGDIFKEFKKIGWRKNERQAIIQLMTDVTEVCCNEMLIALNKGTIATTPPENPRQTCAEKLYTLRNSIVHWNLLQERGPSDYSDSQWNEIFLNLIILIQTLYEKKSGDLTSLGVE